MLKKNLKELAEIKIKADLYAQLYKDMSDEIKEELLNDENKIAADGKEGLAVKLVESNRRAFKPAIVKEVLGSAASDCIKESVDSKKFDKASKGLDKEEIKKCFTTSTTHRLDWEGLDIYKLKLEEKNG